MATTKFDNPLLKEVVKARQKRKGDKRDYSRFQDPDWFNKVQGVVKNGMKDRTPGSFPWAVSKLPHGRHTNKKPFRGRAT